MDITGKHFVVTGAANGIGKEVCIQLSKKHSAKIWACDIDEEALNELQLEIKKYGGDCSTLKLDVTDKTAVEDATKKILAQDGKIDVWINSAGITINGKFKDLSVKDFTKVFAINFFGILYCT